jgi:hypothetical protein
MDIKDNIQNQIFSALLYRKIVLWMDLNINSDKYEDERVVQLFEKIGAMKAQNGYVSTKLNFEPINEEYIGFFAKEADAASDMVNAEIALIGSFTEMEELSK